MPESTTATFLGTDGDRAIVRLDTGAEVTLRLVGPYMPTIGDTVRITRDGTTTLVDGLATPREPTETILAVEPRPDGDGGTVLIATVRAADNTTQTVEVLDHVIDPAPGDSVVVIAGFIIGRRRVPTTSEES